MIKYWTLERIEYYILVCAVGTVLYQFLLFLSTGLWQMVRCLKVWGTWHLLVLHYLVVGSTLFVRGPSPWKLSYQGHEHALDGDVPLQRSLCTFSEVKDLMVMISYTVPTWKSRLRVGTEMRIDSKEYFFLKILIWSPSLWQVCLPVHYRKHGAVCIFECVCVCVGVGHQPLPGTKVNTLMLHVCEWMINDNPIGKHVICHTCKLFNEWQVSAFRRFQSRCDSLMSLTKQSTIASLILGGEVCVVVWSWWILCSKFWTCHMTCWCLICITKRTWMTLSGQIRSGQITLNCGCSCSLKLVLKMDNLNAWEWVYTCINMFVILSIISVNNQAYMIITWLSSYVLFSACLFWIDSPCAQNC